MIRVSLRPLVAMTCGLFFLMVMVGLWPSSAAAVTVDGNTCVAGSTTPPADVSPTLACAGLTGDNISNVDPLEVFGGEFSPVAKINQGAGGSVSEFDLYGANLNFVPLRETVYIWSADLSGVAAAFGGLGRVVMTVGAGSDWGAYLLDTVAACSLDLTQCGGEADFGAFGNNGSALSNSSIYHEAVSAVPLPASLPLLLATIGGLGFLGWRRTTS